MHYKNGRLAKQGDQIVQVQNGNAAGIVHTVNAGSTTCNARVATTTPNDPWVTLGDCLHVDDIKAATIPDSSIPAA